MGMPSVKEINKLFDDWANDSYSLKTDKSRNLYRWVKDKIDDYYKANTRNGEIPEQNFETILYTIQSLSTISDKTNEEFENSNRIKAFIQVNEFPEIYRYFKRTITPSAKEFQGLQSILTDRLLYHIRSKCKTLEIDKQNEILKIRNFF